jgi:hypothetical protein
MVCRQHLMFTKASPPLAHTVCCRLCLQRAPCSRSFCKHSSCSRILALQARVLSLSISTMINGPPVNRVKKDKALQFTDTSQ